MSLKIDAEVKINSEPCVVAWDNRLFIGTDAGTIETFDEKLSPGPTWAAHGVQLFAIAAGDGRVYSSSNDGGVRVWTANGEKVAELKSTGADIGAIQVFANHVYAGDEDGNVIIYENNAIKAKYQLLEEVKDIALCLPFMFTARDLYVTATEITPEESQTRFTTRHVMEGRAPLRVDGPYLFVIARGGNSLQVHEVSSENAFKKLHEVKVSDMILTSLSASNGFAWTGGWDGYIRRWKVANNQLEAAGDINLGCCVNALVAPSSDNAYVLLTGGRVVCVKVA
ncbi:uncharacterized protein [Epargyreus clarus]|uniref:uncharacterized protein n=1 Tax=Epargyreus clarus TaxID=520877 RepID=UPI003C2B04B6